MVAAPRTAGTTKGLSSKISVLLSRLSFMAPLLIPTGSQYGAGKISEGLGGRADRILTALRNPVSYVAKERLGGRYDNYEFGAARAGRAEGRLAKRSYKIHTLACAP